jgi:hypothetical protein
MTQQPWNSTIPDNKDPNRNPFPFSPPIPATLTLLDLFSTTSKLPITLTLQDPIVGRKIPSWAALLSSQSRVGRKVDLGNMLNCSVSRLRHGIQSVASFSHI